MCSPNSLICSKLRYFHDNNCHENILVSNIMCCTIQVILPNTLSVTHSKKLYTHCVQYMEYSTHGKKLYCTAKNCTIHTMCIVHGVLYIQYVLYT